MPPCNFTRHEVAWRSNGDAIQYELLGVPPSQKAWIATIHRRWQILRVVDDGSTSWYGSYPNADAAEAALSGVVTGR